MVSSLQLADIVGDALGIPRQSAQLHLKTIRAAGKISFKGFGRSAAAMTPLDASRLLIAAAGSYFAKDSVRVLERFAELRPMGSKRSRHPFATLEECLALRIAELPMKPAERNLQHPKTHQKFASPRLAETALQLLEALPQNDETDRLSKFAIVRWLDEKGDADVAVFGPEGEKWDRGTEVSDLLNLYTAHRFFQVRMVRRQALLDIAVALKKAPSSSR